MKKTYLQKGFTLIELLVVIVIISILTAIITGNLTGSKAKSRDAKRISDIAQIQLALELFYDRCGIYPPHIDDTTATGNSCDFTLATFISSIPKDPFGSPYQYMVGTNDYVIRTTFETPNPSIDRFVGTFEGTSGSVNCTNAPTDYCVRPF